LTRAQFDVQKRETDSPVIDYAFALQRERGTLGEGQSVHVGGRDMLGSVDCVGISCMHLKIVFVDQFRR
jgi:hypothetical protein